jgi:hypothetical protein
MSYVRHRQANKQNNLFYYIYIYIYIYSIVGSRIFIEELVFSVCWLITDVSGQHIGPVWKRLV